MSPHINRVVLSAALVCICFGCLQLRGAHAEIRTKNGNSLNDEPNEADNTQTVVKESAFEVSDSVNSDLIDKFSWKCANNASCLYNLVNGIVQSYQRGETVKLGLFDLIKLPPRTAKTKSEWNSTETGRSISTFVDFISGNAIRIPVGPMVFSLQRADDDSDYIEVALLKKASSQGRRGGEGALFGGGGGGRMRNRPRKDKKQFQMFIPMYLAATTFGWTLVAAKAVGMLTLKALIISKLAFVVAAMVLIKKFMDNASDKMMYQFPEHTPYVMPYGMDYPIHAMGGAEISTNEMYPAAIQLAAPLGHPHPGVESLGAESNLHPHLADVHNSTQVLAALNAVGLGQKVKREDNWIAKGRPQKRWRPKTFLNTKRKFEIEFLQGSKTTSLDQRLSNPDINEALAAAAAASIAAEEDDVNEEDDIFDEEENVKDTLQFLGQTAMRRPIIYNYLQAHHPFYRA